MTNPKLRIYSFIYQKFLLAQGSVLVLCTDRRSGLGLTPLFGDRRGFMPPQLKIKTKYLVKENTGKKFSNLVQLPQIWVGQQRKPEQQWLRVLPTDAVIWTVAAIKKGVIAESLLLYSIPLNFSSLSRQQRNSSIYDDIFLLSYSVSNVCQCGQRKKQKSLNRKSYFAIHNRVEFFSKYYRNSYLKRFLTRSLMVLNLTRVFALDFL